MNIVQCLRGI